MPTFESPTRTTVVSCLGASLTMVSGGINTTESLTCPSPRLPPVPRHSLIHCEVWRPGALSSQLSALIRSQVSDLKSEDHNYSLITQTARSGQNLVRTLVRDQLHCSTNIAHLAWWEHNTHYCFSSLFWTQTGLGQDLSSTICVL